MRAKKQVIANLKKCYAVSELQYDGEKHLICAAEGDDPCFAFFLNGEKAESLWEKTGGVMTLLQYPYTEDNDPILLATHRFYSPDHSAKARIVYYTRNQDGWKYHVLVDLPFVHRFGILDRNGFKYLIACTIKSASAFENDWTCPGRIWAARLPENIREFNESSQLKLTPVLSGLYQNHGFSVVQDGDESFAMIGTQNGIFQVRPPEAPGEEWDCNKILDTPASDLLFQDYDRDGQRELLVLSPFHGDTISVYKKTSCGWDKCWEYPKKMPFIHAICGAKINGIPYAFVGCRKGDRELTAIHYEKGRYMTSILDSGAGAANCMYFEDGGVPKLLVSNRETDEVAIYTLFSE